MSADTQALLREALRLPLLQRAEIAAELLDSLDEGVADDPDEARVRWLDEINRRAQSVDRPDTGRTDQRPQGYSNG